MPSRNAILSKQGMLCSRPFRTITKLAEFAAKRSNATKSSDESPEPEKSRQQPLYVLGEKIVTTSTSTDKRTLKCSGSISATVGDTKASKEVNFTVQQLDGKITVSVDPFQF
jgi:hypothetical protein